MTTTTNNPFAKLKLGPINAAIWKTDTDNGPLFNVTFDRAYKTESGFGNTSSFRTSDLLVLAKLADMSHTAISGELTGTDGEETSG